jgi:hypothetical protein
VSASWIPERERGDCLSEADAEKRTYAPFSFRAAVYQGLRRDRSQKLQLLKLQKAAFCKKISDAGFRVYSRFEEGGIIRYVLSMIEFKTRRAVEMCCGSGKNPCPPT